MRLIVLAALSASLAFAQLNCSGGCGGAAYTTAICNISPASADTITASVVNTTETEFATTCVIPAGTLAVGTNLKVSIGLLFRAPGTALTFTLKAGFGFTSSFANALYQSASLTPSQNPHEQSYSGLIAGDVGGTATSVAMSFNPSVNANATVPTTGVTTSGPLTFGMSITWSGNTAAYSAQLLSLRVE